MNGGTATTDSYGLNYKTLSCTWLSTLGSTLPSDNDNHEDTKDEASFDVQWLPADACHPNECDLGKVCCDCSKCVQHCHCNKHEMRKTTEASHLSFPKQYGCDPRTCMRGSTRKVAVEGATCDPHLCKEIYFCEECSKCRKHCICNIENNSRDPSIYEHFDAYVQAQEKRNVQLKQPRVRGRGFRAMAEI